MTVPPEAANDALNATLAAMQSLMKRCIKIKEGDPKALNLSDEIARHMARDLKLYAGTATSFSPLLLSYQGPPMIPEDHGLSPTLSLIVLPFTPSALPSRTDLDLIAKPVAEPKLSSCLRARKNPSCTDLDLTP
ncbi:hypothetical protein EV424DRAFT_1541957 [Suillus variegatus]|nr:hypothetical protein EV424DRAFT_1541957 [Suillus variegatus]